VLQLVPQARTPVRRRWMVGLLLIATGLAATSVHADAPQPPLHLGIHNGLVGSDSVDVNRMAQVVANLLGKTLARRVEFEVNYGSGAIGKRLLEPGHFDLALVRPANLTAALLRQGWTLIANGQEPGQGVDFIAQPCPGKPGQVLIGGASLLLLKIAEPPAQTCVAAAAIWKAPQARFLTAAKGSLVDLVTHRVVQDQGGSAAQVLNTGTQSTVPDFMTTMHAAIIGAVSPRVAAQWGQQGGVVVHHQPMPPLALLAAPQFPADAAAALRTALRDPGTAAAVNHALAISGWDAPDPQPYRAFMQWLQAGAAPASR
jgi:hypothetical protein